MVVSARRRQHKDAAQHLKPGVHCAVWDGVTATLLRWERLQQGLRLRCCKKQSLQVFLERLFRRPALACLRPGLFKIPAGRAVTGRLGVLLHPLLLMLHCCRTPALLKRHSCRQLLTMHLCQAPVVAVLLVH